MILVYIYSKVIQSGVTVNQSAFELKYCQFTWLKHCRIIISSTVLITLFTL